MPEGCYSPDEILGLQCHEPHLRECPACRDLYARGRTFLGMVGRAAPSAAAAGESWQCGLDAKHAVGRALILPSEARRPFLAGLDPATPELVLACCEQSRLALPKSPNEAQTWLETAEQILARIPPSVDSWRGRDRRWAEARVKAARGNLLMFRGHIAPAHALLEEARAAFDSLRDEFQTALSARSIAYTLAKLGRPHQARTLYARADRILADYGAVRERAGLLNGWALLWLGLSDHRKARLIFDYVLARLDPLDPFAHTIRRNAILPDVEACAWETALRRVESLAAELKCGDLDLEKARTHRLKGEILLLMGRPGPALDALTAAKAKLAPLGVGYESAQADALLGQAHLALGNRREAGSTLRAALDFYMAEGFAFDLIGLMEVWTRAAEEGRSGDREFAEFRRYWQFAPVKDTVVSPLSV